MFWVNVDTLGQGTGLSSSSSFLSTPTTVANAQTGLRIVAYDPTFTTTVWLGVVNGSTGTILKASTSTSTATIFRQNLTGLGGIAVDSSYVYWTQSDGRVYRFLKN
jgi:hypothetical protein